MPYKKVGKFKLGGSLPAESRIVGGALESIESEEEET